MQKIIVSAGMSALIIKMLDGYKDDKISCKFVEKTGINCLFDVETEMDAATTAAYIEKTVKAMPEGVSLYFSVKPQ